MGEQMSERDELARAIYEDDVRHHRAALPFNEMHVNAWYFDQADAALAWFAEHRGPRVVSTVEELDALPVGSVVRSGDGQIWQRVGSGWDCLSEDGTGGSYPSETVIFQTLPPTATILFTPTTESEDR